MTCAALAGCGGGGSSSDTPAPTPALVAPGTWTVLGSSTAAGVGAAEGRGWVALLADQMQARQVQIDNLARAGTQSSQALPTGTAVAEGQPGPLAGHNVDAALARKPKLVLLSYPTNDAVAGVPADTTVAAWKAIAAAAAAGGAATMVVSTQPRDHLTPAQLATLDQTDSLGAQAFGACWVPVRAALSDSRGAIAGAYAAGDGVHLNDAGHALIQARVAAALAAGSCVRLQ